jgi:predicted DNA-binding helix-hairpin-helix protein
VAETVLYLAGQPVRVDDSLIKNYILNGYSRSPDPTSVGSAIAEDLKEVVPKPIDQFDMTGDVDVNSAKAEALSALPGIGVKNAKLVIENRPYATLEDLIAKVKGVDWLNKLHLIKIDPVAETNA